MSTAAIQQWEYGSRKTAEERAIKILVGTEDGLHEFDAAGIRGAVHHPGRAVTALGAEYPHAWAILDRSEVVRTDGSGGWLERGELHDERANCIADTRAGYLVGTSDAGLFRVTETGLEAVPSFDDVKGRADWYTPWGGRRIRVRSPRTARPST